MSITEKLASLEQSTSERKFSLENINDYHWDFAGLLPEKTQKLLTSNNLRNKFNAYAGDFFSKIFPKYFSGGSLRLGLDLPQKQLAFNLVRDFFTTGFSGISQIITNEKSLPITFYQALISFLENNVRQNKNIPDQELVSLGQQEFINLLNLIPGIEQSGIGYEEHIARKVDSDYITPITFENNSLSQAVLDFWRKAGYLYFDESENQYFARTDLVNWLKEEIPSQYRDDEEKKINLGEEQLIKLFSNAKINLKFLKQFYFGLTSLPQLVKNQTAENTSSVVLVERLKNNTQNLWNIIISGRGKENGQYQDLINGIKQAIDGNAELRQLVLDQISKWEIQNNPELDRKRAELLSALGLDQSVSQPTS